MARDNFRTRPSDPREDALAALAGYPGASLSHAEPDADEYGGASDADADDYGGPARRAYGEYVLDVGSDADPAVADAYRAAATREASTSGQPFVHPAADVTAPARLEPIRAGYVSDVSFGPSDAALQRGNVQTYDDIPLLEDMTVLPGGRTAPIDDLEQAGIMTDALWAKTGPDVQAGHQRNLRRDDAMAHLARVTGFDRSRYGGPSVSYEDAARRAYAGVAPIGADALSRLRNYEQFGTMTAPREVRTSHPEMRPDAANEALRQMSGAAMTSEELRRLRGEY